MDRYGNVIDRFGRTLGPLMKMFLMRGGSAMGGSGASTPTGAAGQAATAHMENAYEPLNKGLQAGVANYLQYKQLEGVLAKNASDIG